MYNTVFLGGTFDLFHKGHKKLISHASTIGKSVVIGITSDTYIKENKNSTEVDSFINRKREIKTFLKKENITNISIISIDDALEPAVSDGKYDAIVVSKISKNGALLINKKRQEKNLKKLTIVEIPMEMAQDRNIISSTRIRKGEIARDGTVYVQAEWRKQIFYIEGKIRQTLKRPWGQLIKNPKGFFKNNQNFSSVVSVGDISTLMLNQKNAGQSISVIDFKVERKKIFNTLGQIGFTNAEKVLDCVNKQGTINGKIFEIAQEAIKISQEKRVVIRVNGEEDLVVIPFILALPLGWQIIYGQPGKGVVVITVEEKTKNKAHKLLLASKL